MNKNRICTVAVACIALFGLAIIPAFSNDNSVDATSSNEYEIYLSPDLSGKIITVSHTQTIKIIAQDKKVKMPGYWWSENNWITLKDVNQFDILGYKTAKFSYFWASMTFTVPDVFGGTMDSGTYVVDFVGYASLATQAQNPGNYKWERSFTLVVV